MIRSIIIVSDPNEVVTVRVFGGPYYEKRLNQSIRFIFALKWSIHWNNTLELLLPFKMVSLIVRHYANC